MRTKEPSLKAKVVKALRLFNELDEALHKMEQSLDASSKSVRGAQKLAEDVEEYEKLLAEHDRAQTDDGRAEDELGKLATILQDTANRVLQSLRACRIGSTPFCVS